MIVRDFTVGETTFVISMEEGKAVINSYRTDDGGYAALPESSDLPTLWLDGWIDGWHDGIEALILAHHRTGVDVQDPDYLEGLDIAIEPGNT
jgi:hypothetical protein